MRLPGFDYTRPFFYMVTLKRLKGFADFSKIVEPGVCELNAITKAFVHVIRGFAYVCPAIEKVECFSVMPDHIHLLLKIKEENPQGWYLTKIVELLIARLEKAYWQVVEKEAGSADSDGKTRSFEVATAPVFNRSYHDYIVKKKSQLQRFTRYIRENPKRHWRRKLGAKYFGRVREIVFLGRRWWAYGNVDLIELPVIEPFKCSRSWREGDADWNAALQRARRVGPGAAGIGTFMSACEKACGHEIALGGGKFIILTPENFPPESGETIGSGGWKTRWHPLRQQEAACAAGKILYISLYEPMGRKATKSELYQRCHEMGDYVVAALAAEAAGDGKTRSFAAEAAGDGKTRSFEAEAAGDGKTSFAAAGGKATTSPADADGILS